MTADTVGRARREVLHVVGLQFTVTLLAGLVATLVAGTQAGGSALFGGFINVAASFYMARRIFAGSPDAPPRDWLARLWLGEIVKFGITAALFALAVTVVKAAFLPLILAYMATFVAYWVGLLRIGFGRAA